MKNLMPEAPATFLDDDPAIELLLTQDPSKVAAQYPVSSAAWAALADRAYTQGDAVASYAYARTGYHRGLDQLRRSGWRGHGPVPWSHVPNQGFLRALHALGRAADAINEADEAARCAQFLRDCDPAAGDALTG